MIFLHQRGREGDQILNIIQRKVTEEHNQHLLRPFEMQEVKDAVFSMHPDKSLGPDGMNPNFFQTYWDMKSQPLVSSA